jgi:excisionase family DNA binding protein
MNKWSIPENLVNKKFISPKELKDVLGISLPTVYRLIESRKLPFFKIGKSLRFLREDIIDYLETHRIDHIM